MHHRFVCATSVALKSERPGTRERRRIALLQVEEVTSHPGPQLRHDVGVDGQPGGSKLANFVIIGREQRLELGGRAAAVRNDDH